MPDVAKLALENRIFARAFVLEAAVHAVRGGLFSASADGILQILIFYYNLFFRLPYDAQANGCEPYRLFLRTRLCGAVFKAPCVGIDAQDLPAELWYEKQN